MKVVKYYKTSSTQKFLDFVQLNLSVATRESLSSFHLFEILIMARGYPGALVKN
jgi:hypothetical protein